MPSPASRAVSAAASSSAAWMLGALVDVVDAVPGGDGLGRVQRVADVDVGEQPVVAVALVLGRVELEGDGLAVEGVPGERGRLGAEARLGLARMDDLGRVDADDPDGLDAARQLDADRCRRRRPRRRSRRGAPESAPAWASGPWSVTPSARPTATATQRPTRSGSVCGHDDRRDTLVSAASNGSSGNDDRANGEQADLLA